MRDNLAPEANRRTTRGANNGAGDIRTIQLMLGHTTLSQTQKYLNVTDEELRQKMQIMWTIRRERKKKQDAKPPAPDLLTGLEGE